jgi:Membrane-bound metallopeptidase
MDNYRLLERKKKNKSDDDALIKLIRSYINKILVCCLIFMVLLIVVKIDKKYKDVIHKNVYEKNFSFAKANELYNKYFGDIIPFEKIVPVDEPVFNEKLIYSKANLYKDGAILTVTDKYLVPVIETGIIVFIGEKDEYGKTIIVQQANGIDVWYGNVIVSDVKLYDYVKKGQLLGEVIGTELYVVFQKNGDFLNYKEYL